MLKQRLLRRALVASSLLALLAPATARGATPPGFEEFEALMHATRFNSPPAVVERTYVSPARNLTLPGQKLELQTGVDITTEGEFGLPFGGAYGLTEKIEAGADFELFFHPFAGKALFSNLKAYGRYLLLPELMALQFTFNVVGALGDPYALSFELDAPILLKLLNDKVLIYIQTQLAFRALLLNNPNDFGMSLALGALGMYLITDSIFANLEHGLSFAYEGEAFAPYADTPVPLGFGGGYLHRPTMTAFRLNLVFFDLTDFDGRGMGIMLTATQFLGGS